MEPTPLKILMLEDTDADAAMIRHTLAKSGLSCQFKVMMAEAAFIQALDEFRPDIILSDNAMPQFTASEALAIQQKRAPHIPFILVTGTVSEEFAAGIIKAGADDYLLKDRLTRLPLAIETAIKQKQTEREKNAAAEQLKYNEEQYRTLIEQAADGIFIADAAGKYIEVNESGCKVLGYSKEELLQMSIKDLVVPDNDPVPSRLSEVNTETAVIQQRYLRKKDGSLLTAEISAKRLKNGNYFAIIRDLTQRIEAEQKLAQNEKRFRALVENNDGIISLVDRNRNAIFRSSSVTRLTGWGYDEFNTADTSQYVHPEDVAMLEQAAQKAVAHPGVPAAVTIRAKHKKGHYIWLEGMVTDMTNDPAVNGIVSNFRDVTEKKEAEQKLIKANRLYFFISQINQMIVRTTDETTLFEEVCRIAVELGRFKMAWIGMIDKQTKKVIPVKHAGEESEYLSTIKFISINDIPEGNGPTGVALREGRYNVSNDIENDDRMHPWKEAAMSRGYRSSISLPIKKFGDVVGAFSVYAAEKDFFDAAEIALLQEAAGDVSFALENFEKELLRKKAEEAVAQSEKRYHTLTDIAPVGIFHTDANGNTTYVNPKWCRISGLTYEEALGNGWFNAVHTEDKQQLANKWADATKASDMSTSEYRFKRADGSIAWVLGQAIPEKNAADEVIGYVGTITDITELKLAEEEIVKEKELSDKIINSLPGIFYLSDPTPKLVLWNNAMEKISGYTKEDLQTILPASLFDPEDQPILRQGLGKAYTDGAADVEIRLLTKAGQQIPFYFTGVRIEYKGRPAVLGIGIDISQLKKAEEEIKKSNERFELIAKATHDGLWDWNLETDELWGNEVHQQLYGLTTADPVPTHDEWKKRIHPDEREKTIQAFEDAKASNQHSYIDEYRFYVEGFGWMNVYGRTFIERNKEGKPVRLVGSMMDITERKKAEEQLAANEKRFRKLVENGNDAFAILDPGGKPLYVSSSVQRVLGYTEEEISLMDMISLVHPDNLAEVQQTMQTVMAQPGRARYRPYFKNKT